MVRRVGSDLARGLRQEAQQVNMSALETLSRLNQSFSEKSNQIMQSQIAENSARANSVARINQSNVQASAQRSQERQQFLGTLGQGIQAFQETEARNRQIEQQQLQAQQQAMQQQEFVSAFTELSQLTTNADRLVSEQGDAAFIQASFDVLSQYPNLKHEDKVKLIDQAYKASGRVNQDLFTKTQKYAEQINNEITSVKKADLQVRLSGITARLSSGNFDNVNDVLGDADNIINEFLAQPSLNDLQRIQVYANALEHIAENSEAGIAHKSELQRKASSYQSLVTDSRFREAVNRFREGNMAANEWELTMMTLAEEYEIPLQNVRTLGDPIGSEREALERQQVTQQLEALHNQGLATDISKADFDRATQAFYAWAMVDDPGVFYELESTPGMKDNPKFKTMVALRDTIVDYRETKLEVSKEVNKLDKALATWQQGATRTIRSVDQANKQSDDLLGILGTIGRERLVENLRNNQPQREQFITDIEFLQEMREWYQVGVDSIMREKELARQSLKPLARRLENYGMLEAVDTDNGQLLQNNYTNLKRTIRESYQSAPKNAIPGGQNGNFNQGNINTNFNFASINNPRSGSKMLVPFHADVASQLRVTSSRGERIHPIRGTKSMHAGVDIAVPMGTDIVFYDNGVVDAVKTDPTGYGYYVDIRSQDGKIHRFAHLKQRTNLKVGQAVQPGSVIGLAGSSGGSTGSHLHWEIRSPDRRYGYDGTYDVEALASDYTNRVVKRKPRGDNLGLHANAPNPYSHDITEDFINNSAPKNSLVVGARAYLQNNTIVPIGGGNPQPVGSVYNTARPYQSKNAPSTTVGFDVSKNKPDNNYGYTQLAQHPRKARKINEVATRLGVPGNWIADIIGFESGFDTKINQSAGLPYTGLIQFGDAAAERMGTSRNELRQMSFEQQMEYVHRYFSFPEFQGRLNSVDKMLAAVWGGAGLVNQIEKDPKKALKWSDGFITFENYLKKLGRDAGRRYDIPYMNGRRNRIASATHTTFTDGCPICNQMSISDSFAVHEGTR